MKVSDFIIPHLNKLGVERPSIQLIDEIEFLINPKIKSIIISTVQPRLIARAFTNTLYKTGVSGEVKATHDQVSKLP